MITRPPSRPQSLLQAVAKQVQPKPPSSHCRPFLQTRHKHDVPIWGNRARQDFFSRHGVPGFLSAETYQETYLQYTRHLADRLNELTLGTVDEQTGTHHLHLKYSHRPEKAHLYNVTAMLSFTRFFWEDCLTESDDPNVRKPGLMTLRSIEQTFGDIKTLREEMLETADAMFGNGFVWLMKGKNPGDMKILATYNTGSPYKEAAPRRDDTDMATSSRPSLSDQLSGRASMGRPEERDISFGRTTAGSFGDYSATRSRHYAGLLDMAPILCVNVWEHQWLRDYGLLGKKAYLAAWWDRIDWQKVEAAHNMHEWSGGMSYQQPSAQAPYSTTGGSSVLDVFER